MKTYNFFIKLGKTEFLLEVNAFNEEEAIDLVSNEYPRESGWIYILL